MARRLSILLVADRGGDGVERALAPVAARDVVHVAHAPAHALELVRTEAVAPSRRIVLVDSAAPGDVVRALRAAPALNATPIIVLARANGAPLPDAQRRQVASMVTIPADAEKLGELVQTLHRYWSAMELV